MGCVASTDSWRFRVHSRSIRPDLVDAARDGEVLAKIVARKRVDVTARMEQTPLSSFASTLVPSDRSLLAALSRQGARFILECKRASPSKGLIREDFDAVAVARAYAPLADGVSVLTDGPYFGGSFEILETIRAHVPAPVLCKDFVLDPYQVYEARRHGADAVLLMMSVLDDDAARACLIAASELAIDCLVEIHDEAELARALALDARIIGINNRDLKTLRTDLAVTERLAGAVPSDRIVVSESGVYTRADVDRLSPVADAFLVGTSLMAQPDLPGAVRRLLFGNVKICGLRDVATARAARDAGASYGGLIFVERSPRCIGFDDARTLTRTVDLAWVGVFVDAPLDVVVTQTMALGLRAVQLHGDEDEAYVTALRQRIGADVEIWRGVGVDVDCDDSPPMPASAVAADRVLFDAKANGQSGGTGRTFSWHTLSERPELAKAVLAGGLGPANITAARATAAWCLDVNSGVEDRPGHKSTAKIHALFSALRGPCRSDGNRDQPHESH